MSISEAEQAKIQGNKLYADGDFLAALKEYLRAIELDPKVAAYFCNAAIAHSKLGDYERAVEASTEAIRLQPSFTKAYYRRAVALMELKEFKRAQQDLGLVLSVLPTDKDVKDRLTNCEREIMRINFAKAIHVDRFELKEDAISRLQVPDDYAGPRLDGFTRMPESFVSELIEWLRLENRLPIKYAYMILHMAKKIMQAEPTVVIVKTRDPIVAKTTICGDIHGQYFDLLHIFEINGYPSSTHRYLFNGDFVDRGAYSIEVALTLLAFKCAFPTTFHLNRGNHESESVNRMHGFLEECKKKYASSGDELFSMFNQVFNTLPLGHVVGNGIFVVHGGLPAEADLTIDQLARLDRFKIPPNGSTMSHLLWSDPRPIDGSRPSHRGEGVLFGTDITNSFLDKNNLRYLVRSHEWESEGYRKDHNGRCITIFSAPNYTGTTSKAAFINLDETESSMNFVQFDAAPYQGKFLKPTQQLFPSPLLL